MAKVFTIAESVAELKQLLADGKIPEVGQIALSMNGMDWRCIDHTEENGVVLMMAAAYDWRPFARPDKEHPWGWNNYEASQIRKELNSEVLADLFGDEQDLLEYWYPGMGKLFLLSTEEVGYEQTEATFAWFRGKQRVGAGQQADAKGPGRGFSFLVAAVADPWLRAPRAPRHFGRLFGRQHCVHRLRGGGGLCNHSTIILIPRANARGV